jgi:hypothetical protein
MAKRVVIFQKNGVQFLRAYGSYIAANHWSMCDLDISLTASNFSQQLNSLHIGDGEWLAADKSSTVSSTRNRYTLINTAPSENDDTRSSRHVPDAGRSAPV